MLRFLTAGESHGPAEVAILEGIPAGLQISTEDIQEELEKRRGGAGRGGRGKIEDDRVKILSGVRHGKTIGSPIALLVENLDFVNWSEKMSIEPINSVGVKLYHSTSDIRSPRPGHADLAGSIKYHFEDIRNVIERASARETVMRVAVGAVCKKLLGEFGIEIASHTVQIGKVKLTRGPKEFKKISNVFHTDPQIRCIDPLTSQKMKEEIFMAVTRKDTLGGIVEIIGHNVPAGLGSYVHFDRKLDGLISAVLMSIPSVKAVEIGEGIVNAQKYGLEVHDEIFFSKRSNLTGGSTSPGGYFRKTNRAGGIEGGVSNGEDIVCRVFHKPLSTLGNALKTVDINTKNESRAVIERSDICVVPRAGVISEAMLAFVLTQSLLEKFGGDSMIELYSSFKKGTKNS